jgi:hypothetical protein
MRRRLALLAMGIVLLSAGRTGAWMPNHNWAYFSWPHAYSIEDSRWYYIYPADAQYVYNYAQGRWTLTSANHPVAWYYLNFA